MTHLAVLPETFQELEVNMHHHGTLYHAFSHSSTMESRNTNAYNHQLGVPLWLMSPENILEVGEEIVDIVRQIVMIRLVRNISLDYFFLFF